MAESTTITTARTTWRLKKYSCAIAASSVRPTSSPRSTTLPAPSPNPFRVSSSPSSLSSTASASGYRGTVNDTGTQVKPPVIEWIHHSDPVLSCELTTTTASTFGSASTFPDAPTMRIVFHPLQSTQSAQEIVYEHLDLASFASPHIQSICPPHELAIRAVYKATMVGIRYFSAQGKLQSFNRFQINFESYEEVLRFLDATKAWIPAKPSSDTQPSSSTARMTNRRPRTSQAPIIPTPFVPATPVAASQLGESKLHLETGPSRSGVVGDSWPQPTPPSGQANWHDAQHLARNAQFALPGGGEQSGINPIESVRSSPHLDSYSMNRLDRMLPQLRGSLRAPQEEPSARGPDSAWNGVRAEGNLDHDIASATELAQLDDARLLDLINNVLHEPEFELLVERVNGVLQRSDGRS